MASDGQSRSYAGLGSPKHAAAAKPPMTVPLWHVVACIVLVSVGAFYMGSSNSASAAGISSAAVPKVLSLAQLETLVRDWSSQSSARDAQMLGRVADDLKAARTIYAKELSSKPAIPSMRKIMLSKAKCHAQSETEAMRLLSVAGNQCYSVPHTDAGGDAVQWVPDGGPPKASSAAECCAACHGRNAAAERGALDKGKDSRRCNVWVYCGDEEACGSMLGDCWLKWSDKVPDAPGLPEGSKTNPEIPFMSGVVYPNQLARVKPNEKRTTLLLHTKYGNVTIKLDKEMAWKSVEEFQRATTLLLPADGYCSTCKFFRSERGALLQGMFWHPGMFIWTPRWPNPSSPKTLDRGMACWTKGETGPYFFINLQDGADGGDDFLCFGKVTKEGMTTVEVLVDQQVLPKIKESDPSMLVSPIFFNMTLAS